MPPNKTELSIVIPCLNEADTLALCIEKVQKSFSENNILGEIIVADNGSNDGSCEIALRLGCRLVVVEEKGYGNALMGGIEAAQSKFIIMADADDSYDFLEIPKFLYKLRMGADLVQGCRLPSGGGRIMPDAMPFSHRYFGNPALTLLARLLFRIPIHDIYCGMRGFTKELYIRLKLRCSGMEFATEMTIKSALFKAMITEVPITLHPDKRKSHKPHLRTFADGWRTLRFFLLLSPKWVFLMPALLLIILGIVGYTLGMLSFKFGNIVLEGHTLLFSSLAILCGVQTLFLGIFAKTFAVNEGILPLDINLLRFYKVFNLERGVIVGILSIILGGALLLWAIFMWKETGFYLLDYSRSLKIVVPGVTLTTLGFQIVIFGFFVSILGMQKINPDCWEEEKRA